MKSILNIFSLTCLFFVSFGVFGQNPGLTNEVKKPGAEEVKTESSVPDEDIFIDGLVRKQIIEENRILPYRPIREADIAWEKRVQRVIDTREKLNLPFKSQELNLFSVFRQLINEGKVTAFSDDKFATAMKAEDIEKSMVTYDTLTELDPETYVETIKIGKNEINWEKIEQYRVKEIWYFDKQYSRVFVKILGIAPIYQSPKDESAGIPAKPIFWIYYPEARESMSKFRVFNDENDVSPMSWAGLFDSRRFSSYIYKRSNVLDYRLKDFFVGDPDDTENRAGIDMLLYSEKIKNELINFEHDLWEY